MKSFNFNQNSVEASFRKILNAFDGATFKDGHAEFSNDSELIDIYYYNEFPGIEVSVVTVCFDEDTLCIDTSEDGNIVVLRFTLDSHLVVSNDKKEGNTLISVAGGYMYSARQSFEYIVPKKTTTRFVTFRLKLNTYKRFNGVSWKALDALLESSSSWLLFETLNFQMETCLKDIFAIQEMNKGQVGFTYGKSFELLTHFFVQLEARKNDLDAIGNLTIPFENLMEIKEELVKNFEHRISVEELAEKFNMSKQKLRLNFKAFFGKSPNQFWQEARYLEAERKLRYTDEQITAIGLDLGFVDSAHFSAEFKKRYNRTPLEYRKLK